jgi:hypothetical protein
MNQSTEPSGNLIYYRLIALWVLCEAMLGAIIFTFRIPVSGLVIGSCAITCISLMGWFVPVRGAILKATIIVAVFKMMLSPQAPPAAYIAVFFQGILGELLFNKRKYFKTACLVLAILALLESALQRILVITIIYGKDLWTGINEFISKLTGTSEVTDYSYFIIFCYVVLHLATGVVLGVWTGLLPERIRHMRKFQQRYHIENNSTLFVRPATKRKKNIRVVLLIVWIVLLGLYIQSFFRIGEPLLPSSLSLRIFIRSVIIVLTWYFLLSPILKQLLHRWLEKKKKESALQVQRVLDLLPATQGLISQSWQLAGTERGWKKISLFCRIVLANTFYNR